MSEMSEKDRISAAYDSFMNAMDIIPGYRAYRRTVQDLLNRAQGKEGTYNPTEFARDLGYSTVPFYTAYDNWLYDRPQNWQQNMIDAATVAIPTAAAGTRVLNQVVKNPKAGFARNPVNWNKLTPAQKQATDRAIEEWNARVAADGFNPKPQGIPPYKEFTNQALNDAVWDLTDNWQFMPIVNGKVDNNVVTRAILPESTADAGFLRHRLSNYDQVIKRDKQLKERQMQANRTLPNNYTKEMLPDGFHYIKKFPTIEGDVTDIGNNVKSLLLGELNQKFPGYKTALEGKGSRQPISKRNNLYYHEYSYPGTPDEVIELARNGKLPWSEAQKAAKEINEQISFAERALDSDVMSSSTKQYMEELLKDARQRKYEFDKEDLRRSLNDLPD